jgi:hypothetical protein
LLWTICSSAESCCLEMVSSRAPVMRMPRHPMERLEALSLFVENVFQKNLKFFILEMLKQGALSQYSSVTVLYIAADVNVNEFVMCHETWSRLMHVAYFTFTACSCGRSFTFCIRWEMKSTVLYCGTVTPCTWTGVVRSVIRGHYYHIYCYHSLEHCDREFESHSRHGCLRLFCVCVVLCR